MVSKDISRNLFLFIFFSFPLQAFIPGQDFLSGVKYHKRSMLSCASLALTRERDPLFQIFLVKGLFFTEPD
jgi:hypothetical protein